MTFIIPSYEDLIAFGKALQPSKKPIVDSKGSLTNLSKAETKVFQAEAAESGWWDLGVFGESSNIPSDLPSVVHSKPQPNQKFIYRIVVSIARNFKNLSICNIQDDEQKKLFFAQVITGAILLELRELQSRNTPPNEQLQALLTQILPSATPEFNSDEEKRCLAAMLQYTDTVKKVTQKVIQWREDMSPLKECNEVWDIINIQVGFGA